MTPIADMIADMMAVGASHEAILAAVRSYERSEAMRKDRKRERDAEHQRNKRIRDRAPRMPDLFERSHDDETRYGDAAIAAESQLSQSDSTDKRNPHKENTSFVRTQEVNSGGGSACARTPSEAIDLLEELGRMVGFEPIDCPPGWCGGSHTIQKFFNQGCPRDVIVTAVRAELKRLSGAPPPERFGWFEKPIARAFANFQRAVPVVAVPKMEIIDGGKSNAGARAWRDDGRSRSRNLGSATDAAAELREYFTRRAEEEERAAASVDRRPRRIPDGGVPP
jgi:hypothetical protein